MGYAPPMEIRRATVEDAEVLARLNHHVHAMHVEAEPGRYRPTVREEVMAWFRRTLAEDGGSEAFIAHGGEEPLGHVIFRDIERPENAFGRANRYLMVDQLAVAPEGRRRGIGRALMDAVADQARARGVPEVQLGVRSFNTDAVAFYEALGYGELQRTLGLRV